MRSRKRRGGGGGGGGGGSSGGGGVGGDVVVARGDDGGLWDEEAVQADLLLHIVDTASTNRDEQIAEVNKVLVDIGAADIPRILVYNKIDLAGLDPRIEQDVHGTICRVFVSAQTRSGLDGLRSAISQFALIPENNEITVQNIQFE
jgi:GTP-binding protein HflX